MTLGQKVRQARIRAGLTQEQAAGGRITRNMLSLIENDLSAPSMKTLEYLAAALGVTAGWLLADDASDEAAERLPRARAMLREGDHRGCAALLEPGAEQASDEELLLLAVSAMELAEQALGAEQYEEAARRAEQALRWNARGLYAQQALSLRLVTKGPGWTLGAVVFLLVGAIVDGASRKRYQREVRGPLVQEAVEAVFPGASYTPDSGIGYTDAREAAIEIAGGYDLVTSRDGIGGTYNGLPFQLSTVWLGLRDWFRDEETGMEREQEKEVFHGPWLLLRTAPLGGTVRLRTRTGLGKAVRLAGRKTGNAEFDQTFVIASDSDEEMQRVLSASMCERLLAVQQCIGKGWICLLSDGRVSVVADTGSGLFDGTGSGAEALRKEYTGALMQARRVMDALQLPGAQ